MLINCPRCGFQQPNDKYCAQCGVDMETFRPAAPPLTQRLFGNPFVQLSILLLVAGGAGFFIYEKGQENLQSRVTYLQSTVQIEPSAAPAPASASQDEPVLSESGEIPTAPTESTEVASTALSAAGNAELGAAALNATPPPAGSPAAKVAGTKTAPHLVVYYAEVSRSALADFVSSSRSTGQYLSFNDYSAGILPNISKAVAAGQVKILHKEDRSLEQKSNQWFLGWTDKRDPSRQIGLNTYFELSDLDSANLRGNIEILRTWREEVSQGNFEIHKRTFPAIFEIGGETGFFMWGVMPRRANLPGPSEDELVNIDLFKILRSPQFRSGESEFVIFVEFDKTN